MAEEPFTGFLPEPIPPVPMSAAEVMKQLDLLRAATAAMYPHTRANLYYALLEAEQRQKLDDKLLKELAGEQVMELAARVAGIKKQVLAFYTAALHNRRPAVSDEQQKALFDELTAAALRGLSPPALNLDEVLENVGRFTDLLNELVAIIVARLDVRRHQDGPDIYFCGPAHPDVQDADGVTFVLDWGEQWNEAMGKQVRDVKIVDVRPWVGRHAIIKDWHAFVRLLARELKAKCVFDQ